MKNDQEVIPRYPFQPTLKIGGFEGPLDLLLHLIRQSKMDVYDIQIEQITQQYFDYLRAMKSHQLEVAGDYFVMAATLMNIKSRLLLPQPEVEEEETNEEVVDPVSYTHLPVARSITRTNFGSNVWYLSLSGTSNAASIGNGWI